MKDSGAMIDGDRIGELRRLAGLSQRALGHLTSVSPLTIRRLEEGGGHGELTLRFVDRLARQLGVELAALLPTPKKREPAADDVAVEAVLSDLGRYTPIEELARALGWTFERTATALEQLERRLQTTGTTLKARRSTYILGSRTAVLSGDQQEALRRVELNRWGINQSSARLLRDALDGLVDREWERKANAWQTPALGALIKQRLVRFEGRRAVVAAPVRFSLEVEGDTSIAERNKGAKDSSQRTKPGRQSRARRTLAP